jgi:hypothetical protein
MEHTCGGEDCTQRVLEMVRQMDLIKCVQKSHTEECFEKCMERCTGENCWLLCMGAVKTAIGLMLARNIIRDAKIGIRMGVEPLDALAISFAARLEPVWRKRCPDRVIEARILEVTLMELRRLVKNEKLKKKLMLLLAPLLSAEYTCVGDEVFDFLDEARGTLGEKTVQRIVAALENGGLVIGKIILWFPPAKAKS